VIFDKVLLSLKPWPILPRKITTGFFMKYLCLVYYEEKTIDAMSQQEWVALNQECIACGEGLRASGHFIAGNALQPISTATTLRMRDGKAQITDGPFAETKEQLAGF